MNFEPRLSHKIRLQTTADGGRKFLRSALPIAFVLMLVMSAVIFQTVTTAPGNEVSVKTVSTEEYQKSLKAQVDNENGSPTDGRNPANQSQTSLETAASTPSGTGTRTDAPASGVTGSTGAKVNPEDVYGTNDKQKATGINSAGCFYDYGVPGQECMPAHMAKADGSLDCNGVKMHFPKGVKVSGTDRFKLDTNGDGVACGFGDN